MAAPESEGGISPVLVLGEALCDLVIDLDGSVTSALGGAPYNTARALGRLGVPTGFSSPVSTDRFGELLANSLREAGVDISGARRTEAPTTLAAATLSAEGSASYRFYVEGTSVLDVEPVTVSRPVTAVMTGGLAIALPSVTAAIEPVLHLDVPVFVDVNCRPAMIDDRPAYIERVHRVASLADVVKVSDEDARWMSGEAGERGVELAVESLLTLGARAVVVTAGASPVSVSTPTGRAEVPVPAVDIVDTIGAGDAFDAGMIAHWFRAGADARGLGDLDALLPAMRAGVVVSGAVCARRGADPPTVDELPDDLWP